MGSSIQLAMLTAITVASTLACNKNEFDGKNEIAMKPPAVNDVAVPCIQGTDKLEKQFDVIATKRGGIVNIKGSFCKVIQDQVAAQGPHIALLVDYSHSMLDNDPLVNGTCSRFEAVKALTSSLQEKFKDNFDKVEFSLTAFGTQASMLVDGSINGNVFKDQYLTSDIFCHFDNASTNYEAAFNMMKDTVFKNVNDEKVKHVFMLTDGVPSVRGHAGMEEPCMDNFGNVISQNCHNAGQTAAEALRKEVKNLNLNVLFLVGADVKDESANRAYLEKVTGDAANVKFAKDAADAAALIKEFKQPEIKTYSAAAATAKVAGAKVNKEMDINLKKAGDGVWEYELSFDVPPEDGEYTFNIVPKFDGQDLGVATVVKVKVTLAD